MGQDQETSIMTRDRINRMDDNRFAKTAKMGNETFPSHLDGLQNYVEVGSASTDWIHIE